MNTAFQHPPIQFKLPPASLTQRSRLVPIRDQGTLERLRSLAAADDHAVLAATHVIVRGTQIIGYLSLGGMPLVQAWFDTQHAHVTDSLKMIETTDAILATQGVKEFCVGVAEDSPFAPHMDRLGFVELGKTVLWHKTL